MHTTEKKIGQGRENAKSYLTAHPEIMEEIEEKVRAHYGIGAEGQEAEEPAQHRLLRQMLKK